MPMKALQSIACAVIAATLWSAGGHAVPSAPNTISSDCPRSNSLAQLVAGSDLIVIAAPSVPRARVRAAMQQHSPDYIDVPLREVSFLKGVEPPADLVVRVYPKKTTYAPSPDALLEHAGEPSLLFLTRVDEGPVGIYLTHSLEALQDASPTRIESVKTEVSRQQALLVSPASNVALPHFNEVRELLAKLPQATPETQQAVFQKLEGLGRDGVPAIAAQMDDRTPLARPHISLINHAPGAFEGLRHYGPELVVDALDAILNQITGFGGSIVNGGSERERQSAVSAWRVYAADMKCG